MTEQEAITVFEEILAIDYRDTIPKYYEAMELAVKDMKEVKKYREIGTVEECKNSVLKILEAYNKAIDDFANTLKQKYSCLNSGKGINNEYNHHKKLLLLLL